MSGATTFDGVRFEPVMDKPPCMEELFVEVAGKAIEDGLTVEEATEAFRVALTPPVALPDDHYQDMVKMKELMDDEEIEFAPCVLDYCDFCDKAMYSGDVISGRHMKGNDEYRMMVMHDECAKLYDNTMKGAWSNLRDSLSFLRPTRVAARVFPKIVKAIPLPKAIKKKIPVVRKFT